MSKMFVIHAKGNRKGEFEFCCSTQENYTKTLDAAIKEITGRDPDYEDAEGVEGYDPSEFTIYEMKLKRIRTIKLHE